MSYLGNEPQFTQYPSKFFNGDGSAMTVSLDYAPPNAAALLVFIDGVRQDTSAYTLSGTSMTFTGTVPSGTNNVQVVHMGLTVDVGVPGDDTISTAKIQDDAVTADKLASGLANATHTGDVTGATALTIANDAVDIAMLSATGTADSTTFLRGDNSWASAGSSAIVVVHMSSSQIFTKDVWEKIDFDTEVFDTNGEYNTTDKRFTPTTAGYYQFSMSLVKDDGETQVNNVYQGVYKNGSLYKSWKIYANYPYYQIESHWPYFQTIVYCNGSSDYLEPWFAWGANGQVELDVYPDSLTTGKSELTILKVD